MLAAIMMDGCLEIQWGLEPRERSMQKLKELKFTDDCIKREPDTYNLLKPAFFFLSFIGCKMNHKGEY